MPKSRLNEPKKPSRSNILRQLSKQHLRNLKKNRPKRKKPMKSLPMSCSDTTSRLTRSSMRALRRSSSLRSRRTRRKSQKHKPNSKRPRSMHRRARLRMSLPPNVMRISSKTVMMKMSILMTFLSTRSLLTSPQDPMSSTMATSLNS